MMQNSKSIGNKIATTRKKNNLSQAELAQQVSISSQAVGKWERGESMPDITTLNRLAEILGVDLNYFSESFQSVHTIKPLEASDEQSVEFPSFKQKKKFGWNWDMSLGNWVDADFSGLKNLQEKLSSSNIKNSKFLGSELSGLVLENNNIDNCDFSGSDIKNSKILTSSLHANLFLECSFVDAEFSESEIKNCNFTSANFSGAQFLAGNFVNNKIENALWKFASFKDNHIVNIEFSGVIEDCSFVNCSFSNVTFQNSKLLNTFFKCKKLKRIKFVDCQADRMTYEFLKNGKADLTGLTLLP